MEERCESLAESGCLLSSCGVSHHGFESHPLRHFFICDAPVAQWNRASDYGSEGRGFESSRALSKCLLFSPEALMLGWKCELGLFSLSDFLYMSDPLWMRKALEVARRGAVLGEVPVGALIVRDGVVLARAHNQREQTKDPTAHAELIAIRAAASSTGDWRLVDTTLYVTLEPCPMCSGAIVLARMPRVVYAASDPKAGAAGTLFNLLQDQRLNHQVEITQGILAEESSHLLKSFFRKRRT